MKVELELNVPSSLSEITLGEYQKYVEVLNNVEDREEGGHFISLKALEIFCGLKLKDSYKLPVSVFDGVLGQIYTCLNEETPLIKRFWFRGNNGNEVEYGLIPDLHEMSFGEYVDLDTFISDWKNMHKAMAVLYRPITDKSNHMYKIKEYESVLEYEDLMKYMPVNVTLGAVLFFYRLGIKLSNHMMDSILNQMEDKERTEAEKKFLEQSGVGINQFMQSLKEMSQNLTRLQESQFTSV